MQCSSVYVRCYVLASSVVVDNLSTKMLGTAATAADAVVAALEEACL
jgi:hypothetical protein